MELKGAFSILYRAFCCLLLWTQKQFTFALFNWLNLTESQIFLEQFPLKLHPRTIIAIKQTQNRFHKLFSSLVAVIKREKYQFLCCRLNSIIEQTLWVRHVFNWPSLIIDWREIWIITRHFWATTWWCFNGEKWVCWLGKWNCLQKLSCEFLKLLKLKQNLWRIHKF